MDFCVGIGSPDCVLCALKVDEPGNGQQNTGPRLTLTPDSNPKSDCFTWPESRTSSIGFNKEIYCFAFKIICHIPNNPYFRLPLGFRTATEV